jgi:hypothetical protein
MVHGQVSGGMMSSDRITTAFDASSTATEVVVDIDLSGRRLPDHHHCHSSPQ